MQFLNVYNTLGNKELFELESMEKLQTVRLLIHVVYDCGEVEEYTAELGAECSTLWKRRNEHHQRRRAAEKAQAEREKKSPKTSPNQAEKNKENLANGSSSNAATATSSISLLPPVSPASGELGIA